MREDVTMATTTAAVGIRQDPDPLKATRESPAALRPKVSSLHLKSVALAAGSRQATPLGHYGEAAFSSLWDTQRGTGSVGLSRPYSLKQQGSLGKTWTSHEPYRREPEAGPLLDESANLTANASFSQCNRPLEAISRKWGPLDGSQLGFMGSIRGTSQLHSSEAAAISDIYEGLPVTRPGGFRATQRGESSSEATGTEGRLGAASYRAGGTLLGSHLREASSGMRAGSASALKVGGMSAITGQRCRRLSPTPSAMMSSPRPQGQGDLSSSPLTSKLPSSFSRIGSVLADVDASLLKSSRPPANASREFSHLDASDFEDTGDLPHVKRGMPSSASKDVGNRGAQPFLLPSSLSLDTNAAPFAASLSHTDRRVPQPAASRVRPTGGLRVTSSVGRDDASADVSPRADLKGADSTASGAVRTERVKAFIGFLRELYIDSFHIPAASVIDCLATLASYSQGLPALQGASPPWCCVAEKQITREISSPICLKDRVVVMLLNSLFSEQVLECAQMSSSASEEKNADSRGSDESSRGLGRDPLGLMLLSSDSGSIQVSLQPTSSCAFRPGVNSPSLLPLGSLSSAALAVSALETISRQHVPVGASLPHRASARVHLSYTSVLRWLWEELCRRRAQSAPFDLCTSLIACEACSPSICSQLECSAMLPQPSSLPKWLLSCNLDLAVLLLLSLASRSASHPLTFQLLEQTSFSLHRCSAVGLAAWLRASAVLGLSSLEKPAFFGRVLNAVTRQMPKMPLGTLLADVLWGLTLCGIPSMQVFSQAVAGIARNLHMFELDDLCLIGCCYALQARGFVGVTGDKGQWSYRGYFLPPDFFRRLTGLKAYCLLGCVKMADTGPTPLLEGPSGCSEPVGSPFIREKLVASEAATPYELVRVIVEKCQGLRTYVSLHSGRLLDFTEKIMEKAPTSGPVAVHKGADAGSLGDAVSSVGKKHLEAVDEFHDAPGDFSQLVPREVSKSGDEETCSLGIAESCLPPNDFSEGCNAAQPLRPPPNQEHAYAEAPATGELESCAVSELTFERQVSGSDDSRQVKFTEPFEDGALSTDSSAFMWGDQHVPAPAVLSALHDYGAEAQISGLADCSAVSKSLSLLRIVLSLASSCASCAAQAICGYIFLMVAMYAFSFFS
ncbi:hypothetical protein Efla_002004 [Eimeria flavescens]